MDLTNNSDVMEILDSPEFEAEKDRLVEHYNITASAKYTLDPRDEFIRHIIKAFLEIANNVEAA